MWEFTSKGWHAYFAFHIKPISLLQLKPTQYWVSVRCYLHILTVTEGNPSQLSACIVSSATMGSAWVWLKTLSSLPPFLISHNYRCCTCACGSSHEAHLLLFLARLFAIAADPLVSLHAFSLPLLNMRGMVRTVSLHANPYSLNFVPLALNDSGIFRL